MFIILMMFTLPASADCYRVCAEWDAFCKSPEQIVATKCRLGVPVKWDQCKSLGIPTRYMIRGGGSLVDGLPCTNEQAKEMQKAVELEF